MSVHRIKIESDSITAVQVNPTWSGEIELTRQNNGVYFRSKPGGEFQFKADEYTLIHDAPDCEKIEIWLEEKCGEDWVERWRGKFTTYDVKFDENKCLAKVSPKTIDDFDCMLDNWGDEYAVRTGGALTVRPIAGTYEAGVGCCSECVPFGDPIPTDPVCDIPDDYCFDQNHSEYEHDGPLCEYLVTSCFHRIVGIGTPSTPPPYDSGWTYLSGNDWWRCPGDEETELPVFDQGRVFNDCLEWLVFQYPCSLTVRSHFLGINATHAAPPSNIAYDFATANYQNLQLHQKSDIKRPFATDPAQSFVWKMSLKKLLADLETMWQVYWIVDGTDLILEHISYFDANTGFDVTEKNIRLDYGKQEGGAPNTETFTWADGSATFTETHRGWPIIYGDCGDGKLENRVNYFSNDVYYISTVANQEEIADAGFCLIATAVTDGVSVILDGNASLGWEQIHANLFQHNRFFEAGTMNDAADTFLSTRKTRKLEAFKLTVCCDDDFNPADTIETLVGTSQVQKATVNYFAGTDTNLVTIEANI